MKKTFLTLIFTIMLPMFAMMISTVSAQDAPGTDDIDVWGTGGSNHAIEGYVTSETKMGEKDPREMAASVINVMLGFLGIIAVVIILLGGFKWMTAAGNDDKVGEARKLLAAGVIGLIIILMSYGLAQFVLKALTDATTATP